MLAGHHVLPMKSLHLMTSAAYLWHVCICQVHGSLGFSMRRLDCADIPLPFVAALLVVLDLCCRCARRDANMRTHAHAPSLLNGSPRCSPVLTRIELKGSDHKPGQRTLWQHAPSTLLAASQGSQSLRCRLPATLGRSPSFPGKGSPQPPGSLHASSACVSTAWWWWRARQTGALSSTPLMPLYAPHSGDMYMQHQGTEGDDSVKQNGI